MDTPRSQAARVPEQLHQLEAIPALPAVARRIVAAVTDDEVSLEDVVATLETSPEITARLLGFANSAYYGMSGQVCTLADAVIRVLGLNATRSLSLALALAEPLRAGACAGFDPVEHWARALVTAELAQRLCNYIDEAHRPSMAVAYTAGLLSNLGVLALVYIAPEAVSRAVTLAASGASLGPALLDEVGIDHRSAGAVLAERWQLPARLATVIRHCDDPGYRQADWPLVVLIGACVRYAHPGLEALRAGVDYDAGLRFLDIQQGRRDTILAECLARVDALAESARLFA